MNSATPTDPGATPARAILLLALASFVGAANLRVCDALLPQIAAELGVTVGTAATMVTAFAVAYGVCQIVVGPLGDARGKLLMVVLGSLWAGIATIVCAAMPSLAPLVLFRFLAGAGAAAVIPLAIAWIGDVVAYERRQALLARYISGQILGIVFGQAAGGFFGELIGWRATLLMLGVLHIGAGLLLLKERRRLSIGVTLPGKPRWADAAFQTYRVLRQPWVRVVLISVFIEGMAMFGALAYVGADLHHRFGLGLGMVGALLASFGAGALLFAASASWLVPKLGQPGLAAVGALLLAAGYGTLVVMPWLWLAVPAIACIGLGFYMLHNTLQVNATQMAPEARGLAVSLFAFFLFTGQSLGVALGAPVVDRFGARPVFAIAAVILILIAFWFRARLIRQTAAS
jgi:MFS transporter, YNFM family, putative membrane transport protein